MKTPCLGAYLGSLNKTLVTCTHKLGASGNWVAHKSAALDQASCLPNRSLKEQTKSMFL